MAKALAFIDPDQLSMTIVLTALNRFLQVRRDVRRATASVRRCPTPNPISNPTQSPNQQLSPPTGEARLQDGLPGRAPAHAALPAHGGLHHRQRRGGAPQRARARDHAPPRVPRVGRRRLPPPQRACRDACVGVGDFRDRFCDCRPMCSYVRTCGTPTNRARWCRATSTSRPCPSTSSRRSVHPCILIISYRPRWCHQRPNILTITIARTPTHPPHTTADPDADEGAVVLLRPARRARGRARHQHPPLVRASALAVSCRSVYMLQRSLILLHQPPTANAAGSTVS